MRRALVSIALSGILACGGAVEPTGSSGSSSGKASSSSSGGSSGAPAPTSGSSSGTDDPPPPVPTGEPVPPPAPIVYRARAEPGGLDHLFVTKVDFQRDTCVRIHAASPVGGPGNPPSGPYGDIAMPPSWGVVSVTRSIGANRCQLDVGSDGEDAIAAKGVMQWTAAAGTFPCSIQVDATLVFASTAEQFSVKNLAVDKCQ